MKKLTKSLEDYLEAILIISKTKKVVRVKDLVDFLTVKSASVNGALKKLEEGGYIIHEHYGYIEFTGSGQKAAENILKKHKLISIFLTEVLNIEPNIAEKDACLMEHNISNETYSALLALVEFMKQETKNKEMWFERFHEYIKTKSSLSGSNNRISLKLTECKTGMNVKILEVNTGGGALKNLAKLGLNINNIIQVKRKSFFSGPVLVEYRDTEIAIGNGLAGKITVERM